MQTVKLFLIAMASAAILDAVWMKLIAGNFYKQQLGSLARPFSDLATPHWIAIILIYVAIAGGIIFFVLPHAITVGSAVLYGAGFGLILYGLYELTNYALLSGWTLPVLIIDTLWGIVLCALSTLAVYYFSR